MTTSTAVKKILDNKGIKRYRVKKAEELVLDPSDAIKKHQYVSFIGKR